MAYVVSNSDRSCFKNCRRKWDLTSPNRQNYIPIKKQSPLWLGSLVHEALERYYQGDFNTPLLALEAEIEKVGYFEKLEYAEEIKLASIMLEHYTLVYPGLWAEPFDVICTEMPFQIPLNDSGDMFAGTIDGVIRMKDSGAIAILEHKTFSMHKDPQLHGIDDQTAIYPPALNLLISQGKVEGIEKHEFCELVLYNGLWKKEPAKLKILKDGSLSKAKGTFTTMTPQWLEKKYSNIHDISLDNVELMRDNIKKFFPRFEIYRSREQQQQAVERLLEEVRDMTREDIVLYHNPTTECSWKCGFVEVCEMMNAGIDTASILATRYEKAPSRGEAYEDGGDN